MMTGIESAVGSILRGWFPQLDGVNLGIVDSGEAAIRIVLRIEPPVGEASHFFRIADKPY